jgi:2-oxoisovalerate dehydrogenase E2 component (dihydrolipoyl transacylase)
LATTVAIATRTRAEKPVASPAVRRRARELGIRLQYVSGSGPSGRIGHADLDAYLASTVPPFERASSSPAQLRGAFAATAGAEVQPDAIDEQQVVGVRRKIAEHLQQAKRRIPHFSYVEEVDMSALEHLRAHLNEKYAVKRPRLTLLPFIVKALARALPSHPQINARYDDENGVVRRYRALHVGIATQTPNGLLVPVLRDAGARDLWDCAAGIARLAARAREGKAARDELAGSTITVTSLGALGGVAFTPIINYPEVAIVGVNRLIERPVIRDGKITARTMMNLSSSFDHRVVDGWDAAQFVQELKQLLEQPATLFIDPAEAP